MTTVIIHYLETDRVRFRPVTREVPGLSTRRVEIPLANLNRFFYAEVGRDWEWTDRIGWTEDAWKAYVNRPTLETWVGYCRGTPFGYHELETVDPANVQIAYFGLLPDFIGKGLGGILLTHSVERAFEVGAERVWLHTCSLDHPAALPNYLARGFHEFRRERVARPTPRFNQDSSASRDLA